MIRTGWLLRVPSMIYFEWIYESIQNNFTKPETYFLQMMQSMFIVPETGKDVFPAINIVLQFLLGLIAHAAFVSVAVFNLRVVKKLYVVLICIVLFVLGCTQYKLILLKLNSEHRLLAGTSAESIVLDPGNSSGSGGRSNWQVYSLDLVQFVPVSQFRSAALIFILPIIYCPWLVFVQYSGLMSNQLLALSYGVANLPGLCLALNLPTEAQIFTYNFAVTCFIIAIVYEIVLVCVALPRSLSDLAADLFVLINFNHHEAALLEVPGVLWRLFGLGRQLLVFWPGLLAAHALLVWLGHSDQQQQQSLLLIAVAEAVQSPLGFVGFSVVSCHGARAALWLVQRLLLLPGGPDPGTGTEHRDSGIAEGFSTLVMMLCIDRAALRTAATSPASAPAREGSSGDTSQSLVVLVGLIMLSSVLETAGEMAALRLAHLAALQRGRRHWLQHLVPLATTVALLLAPLLLTWHLLMTSSSASGTGPDYWLLTVLASLLTSPVRLLQALLLYGTGASDSSSDNTSRLLTPLPLLLHGLEAGVALALLLLLLFTQRGPVSLLLLLAHAYFNIWERVRVWLRAVRHRRAASAILQRMYSYEPTAIGHEQDDEEEELCVVCRCSLTGTAAAVTRTPCRHLFHRGCLARWLLVRHCCPLCSCDFTDITHKDDRKRSEQSMEESDTESLSSCDNERADGDVRDGDEYLVSSTSSDVVYDDEDIDLKVYQELDSEGRLRLQFPGNRDDEDSSNVTSDLEYDEKDDDLLEYGCHGNQDEDLHLCGDTQQPCDCEISANKPDTDGHSHLGEDASFNLLGENSASPPHQTADQNNVTHPLPCHESGSYSEPPPPLTHI